MISDLGERLKGLCENMKYSQAESARHLGVNPTVISQYESNSVQPSVEMIIRLAALFSVTTDYLFGLESNDTKSTLNIDINGLNSKEITILKQINKPFDDYVKLSVNIDSLNADKFSTLGKINKALIRCPRSQTMCLDLKAT